MGADIGQLDERHVGYWQGRIDVQRRAQLAIGLACLMGCVEAVIESPKILR